MPEMNFLNVPGIDQASQSYRGNKLALERAQVEADREDQTYNREQQQANTRWLAGATRVALNIHEQDPNRFYEAVDELGRMGIERGVIDPESWNLEAVTPDLLQELNDEAMIELGGRRVSPVEDPTSAQRNLQERQALVEQYGEGSPQVSTFDSYVRAPRVTEVAGVPSVLTPAGVAPLSTQEDELSYVTREAEARERGERAGRPSTTQTRIDEQFAAEYIALTAGGGLADAQKAVIQLDEVYRTLQSGEDITGMLISMQPRWLLAQTNPEALDTREQVEEIVQRNLRLVLGAQFTEKEGTRLIERAYNPALDEEFNAVRVQRLFDQIRTAAQFKLAMVRHYEENGTLRGFEVSRTPSMEDFWQALQYRQGDVVNGYRFMGGDPGVRENWQRVAE